MVAIGNQNFEAKTVENLARAVDNGYKYGVPVMGVTAVGREMARDARYFSTAARICAENGANIVKTYYCDGFAKVVNSCPVPIVIAISEGAAGVDMGRNVFQSEAPAAMIQAVRGVVHDNLTPDQAYEMFRDLAKK